MNDELEINCPHHGRASLASVCGHLIKNRGTPLGFIENNDDPVDKQGWCYACELVYLQEEDKTERFIAFTDYTVVCSHCYDQIKAHHQFDVPDGDRDRTRDDG
ncbi:hypothetical protein J2W35_005061 [Variovorax boronicumulans]|uniref:hypothetical protein n=1 Tax=Variovorax boronicumulans TaxID=436515 RepID=UPI0027841BAA|nr:hypothetical protein [Variovorax boronicumulans]MDQ0084687.1 hypothetical protein [Variovorax boronicumulans]